MSAAQNITPTGLWAGRIVSGFAALFTLMDGTMKLFKPSVVLDANARLGFPESRLVDIGLLLIACTIAYLVPRISILGAVLLTGYLGGAVAIQVRAGSSLFETMFPVILGALVWGGLWLRDNRVRQLFAN